MTGNFIETKVSCDKVMENGLTRRVKETYFVEALNFTEAETRTIEEIAPLMNGEFNVVAARRSSISDIFFSEDLAANRWYKVKILFLVIDEKTGLEKATASTKLVQASDILDAVNKFEKGMGGSMLAYRIVKVEETPVEDVFTLIPEAK